MIGKRSAGDLFGAAEDKGLLEEGLPPAELIPRAERFLAARERHYDADASGAERPSRPGMFNALVPLGPETTKLIAGVAWYFDELVLADPFSEMGSPEDFYRLDIDAPGIRVTSNFEVWGRLERARAVVTVLKRLLPLRGALQRGQLKIARVPSAHTTSDEVPLASVVPQELAQRYLRETSIERAVQAFPGNTSFWTFFRVALRHYVAVSFRRNAPLPPMTTESARLLLGDEFAPLAELESIPEPDASTVRLLREGLAEKVIEGIVGSSRLAAALRCSFLATTPADYELVRVVGGPGAQRAGLAYSSLSLALPFLDGFSTEELFELREDMPEEFLAFRARVVELVAEHGTIEEAAIAAESEFRRQTLALEKSLRGICESTRARGWGVPAAVAFGTLIATALGEPSAMPALGVGVLGAVRAFSDSRKERRRIEGQPGAFLWQANRRKPTD